MNIKQVISEASKYLNATIATVVYPCSGYDTKAFTFLHPDFLSHRGIHALPNINLFILVDNKKEFIRTSGALNFSDDFTTISETKRIPVQLDQYNATIVYIDYLSKQAAVWDNHQRRALAVLLIQSDWREMPTLFHRSKFVPDVFIGVCDGCAFGGNENCVNDLSMPTAGDEDYYRALPLPRFYVTDHFTNATVPNPLEIGDRVTSQDEKFPYAFEKVALLTTEWGDYGRVLIGGATVFKFIPTAPRQEETRNLLLEIAKCREVSASRQDARHPCHAIVNVQANAPEFYLPEPWSGHLDRASILFISSNPSIDMQERFPTAAWPDHDIVSFFADRFSPREAWTNGFRIGLHNGDWAQRPVPFWTQAHKRACELLPGAIPGVDYTLTEVVHCKSENEIGVRESVQRCYGLYFDRILQASSASVLVVLGERARWQLREMKDWDITVGTITPLTISGRERLVCCLPHPNSREKRTFRNRYTREDLQRLVAFVRRNRTP